jgi:hypothetical protein
MKDAQPEHQDAPAVDHSILVYVANQYPELEQSIASEAQRERLCQAARHFIGVADEVMANARSMPSGEHQVTPCKPPATKRSHPQETSVPPEVEERFEKITSGQPPSNSSTSDSFNSARDYLKSRARNWYQDLKHEPTEEQCEIVMRFAKGEDLVIKAFAGAAKTTTLVMCANFRPKAKTMYVAYNSAIAREAGQAFAGCNVEARTMHSIARRAIVAPNAGYRRKIDLNNGDIYVNAVATFTHLPNSDNTGLSLQTRAICVRETLNNFLQSEDPTLMAKHVTNRAVEVIREAKEGNDAFPADAEQRFCDYVLRRAQVLFDAMKDASNECPITHDFYLKLFQLQGEKIPAQTILIDETQDFNPVVIAIIADQSAQKVMVGDEHQSIYQWRGARGTMDHLPGRVMRLTTSFRFGPKIARRANELLTLLGEESQIKGAGADPDQAPEWTNHYAVIARNNATLLREAAKLTEDGKRFRFIGGFEDVLKRVISTHALYSNNMAEVKDPMIRSFGTWENLKRASEFGAAGDLSPIIGFVEAHGAKAPQKAFDIRDAVDESAPIVLTTAHKSKGLEFDNVVLADDFNLEKALNETNSAIEDIAEFNLAYVAITRAKKHVSIPSGISSAIHKIQKNQAT